MESYDYPPSEDVLLGTPDGRHLSPVRRFFCLLTTFDFLFTVLLWTLCVILIHGGQPIEKALLKEILQYSLYTSIFDVVMCAGCRFTILILFYALLRSHHWLPVAFTTTASCCFLLTKVFLFDWTSTANSMYPVMLVLASFILSWSEAWFLDFRVVPQERQAAMYLARHSQGVGQGSRGVIPWLGQSVSQIVTSIPVTQSYPESVANFYSPLESPIPSDGEHEHSETESMEKKLSKTRSDTPETKMWLQQGPVIAEELLERINSSTWIREKSSELGDNVFYFKSHHKIYLISGVLPVPPEDVVKELFYNFESMPEWNPNVIKCQILQKIDARTDVTYQVSKSGGPVSSRDFVTLRHYQTKPDGTHILAAVSVKHTLKPANLPKLTRGTNGVGGWIISAVRDEPSRTEFQWVLDVDLRLQGWMPKGVIDSAMVSAALETIKCLRRKLEFLRVELAPPAVENDAHGSSVT